MKGDSSKAWKLTDQAKTILTQISSDPIYKWGIIYNLPGMIEPQVRMLYRTLQKVIIYVTYKLKKELKRYISSYFNNGYFGRMKLNEYKILFFILLLYFIWFDIVVL